MLAYPNETAKRIVLLRGRVQTAIVSKVETLELDFSDEVGAGGGGGGGGAREIGEKKTAHIRATFGKLEPGPSIATLSVKFFRGERDDEGWQNSANASRTATPSKPPTVPAGG